MIQIYPQNCGLEGTQVLRHSSSPIRDLEAVGSRGRFQCWAIATVAKPVDMGHAMPVHPHVQGIAMAGPEKFAMQRQLHLSPFHSSALPLPVRYGTCCTCVRVCRTDSDGFGSTCYKCSTKFLRDCIVPFLQVNSYGRDCYAEV